MANYMSTPKGYIVRRMTMSSQELMSLLNQYKFQLYQHIDLPERCHKQNYIDFLERNINDLEALLKPLPKAA